ncbi:Protein kinase domain - like 10 [Theobroma cacao]|nr:Protein kinase domain - like 10 [Theobroma cacao]
MGCICSKGASEENIDEINDNEKDFNSNSNKASMQLFAPAPSKKEELSVGRGGNDGSVRRLASKTFIVERPQNGHQRLSSVDMGAGVFPQMVRIVSTPRGAEGELVAAGWPSWLASVAGEAVKGWLPRRVESFEKLDKVGQGTYSSVYKARDLETGKFVAMKKVRFVNMDAESVRFMAREIIILRKLDHPNVMKLEGLVTSRMSGSLYLIKCYMQQLLRGLEHCHSRGVLHRDIKGSNLLIDNSGVLKIADFGLATFFQSDQKQPLTSRVVTLWYRAPELLFGATEYGVAIDLWSAGCILAELFAGKPIMPGRTEVEQMHKIFKLCGSPSEEYWQKIKLPQATSFKPQQPYKRCVADTFRNFPCLALSLVDKLLAMEPQDRGSAASALRSEFFGTEPFPCDPSNLPKYPPSKELDARRREEEARRKRAEAVKGRGPESVRRGSREFKGGPTPEFIAQGQSRTSTSPIYNHVEDGASGFRIDSHKVTSQNGLSHSSSMVHPSAVRSLNKAGSTQTSGELRTQNSLRPQADKTSHTKDDSASNKETGLGHVARKKRIHCSGPLMPPGGNIEDILKEHERQVQQAVRKARLEKSGTDKNCDVYTRLHHNGIYGR